MAGLSGPTGDVIRLQSEMFAEMLRVSAMGDAAAGAGCKYYSDACQGSTLEEDDPEDFGGMQSDSGRVSSSLTPERREECKQMASKLDQVACALQEKYAILAKQKLVRATSYEEFESAVDEALKSSDPDANQMVLLYQLTRDAVKSINWPLVRHRLVTWGEQFFQRRIAAQVVQDSKSLQSCVEEAVSANSKPTTSTD